MRDGVRCVLSYQLPRGKCFVNKSAWDVKRVTFCFVNKRVSWSVLMVERFVIGFQVERKRTLETLRSAPLYRRISLAIRSLGLRPRLRHYAPPWSVNGRGASSRVVVPRYVSIWIGLLGSFRTIPFLGLFSGGSQVILLSCLP